MGHTKCPGLFDMCTNAEKLSNHDDLAAFNLLSYVVGLVLYAVDYIFRLRLGVPPP